jgi:hypothetical protein
MFGPATKDVSKKMSHIPGPRYAIATRFRDCAQQQYLKVEIFSSEFWILSATAIEHT